MNSSWLRLLPIVWGVSCIDIRPECDYARVLITEECPTESFVDWEEFGEELYKARALTFLNQTHMGMKSLQQLVNLVTHDHGFHVGFECPLATASALYSLATHMAHEERFHLAQALIFMGFVYVRDKGFYDCAPWPVMGWDMLLAGRFVNQRLHSVDSIFSRYDIPKNFTMSPSKKIAIVSVCAYGDDQPIKSISRENHSMYSNLHGYDLFHFESKEEVLENRKAGMNASERNPFFWKVNAVKNVLEFPDYSWILWADCDAFFTDPERTIDSIIEMHIRPNLKSDSSHIANHTCVYNNAFGVEAASCAQVATELLITVDSTGINNGVWLLHNSVWSNQFLSRWWNSNILQGRGVAHNCSDQSTMQHELLHRNMISQIENVVNMENAHPHSRDPRVWPPEVRTVPQEYLQSFHRATAQSVISREWEEGDFIKHHPGCHYYKKACQAMYLEAHNHFLTKLDLLLSQTSSN